VVFTDAATNAALLDHIWALNGDGLSIRSQHHCLFKLNGFLRDGAHLLTGDTAAATCPRQAAIAIDIGMPNNPLAFIFKGEVRDCSRWAYLAAGVTGIITIPYPWYKHRCPDTNPTGF
jgi:hypothetical protein